MNKEFLGRGWAFPFHFDSASGAVAYSEFEENIRQNIMIIIGTRVGERQMLYLLRSWIYQFGEHKASIIFMTFLSSPIRVAGELDYFINVFELTNALSPRKPLLL